MFGSILEKLTDKCLCISHCSVYSNGDDLNSAKAILLRKNDLKSLDKVSYLSEIHCLSK